MTTGMEWMLKSFTDYADARGFGCCRPLKKAIWIHPMCFKDFLQFAVVHEFAHASTDCGEYGEGLLKRRMEEAESLGRAKLESMIFKGLARYAAKMGAEGIASDIHLRVGGRR